MPKPVSTSAYRYAGEILILLATLAVVAAVIAITAAATVCGSLIFILGIFGLSYAVTRAHHQDLIRRAHRVSLESSPNLWQQIELSQTRLQPGNLDIYVVPSRSLNAYTFGLSNPKVIVLYAPLLQLMEPDELRFVIGHEMGHVRLGHTWLNSVVGGMAGIPSTMFINVLLALVFRWWNRTCEYSADRAGLLACADLNTAISALVKISAPGAHLSTEQMALALRKLDAEDDDPVNRIGEFMATHPLTIRRIERLRQYAASSQYQRLQKLVDENLSIKFRR